MKVNSKTRRMAYIAMIAAIYTALTLALGYIAYGPMQLRVSEALTLWPAITPLGIWGVTLGCAVSNAVGFALGLNEIGWMDIVFGTLATFLGAVCTYWVRNIRVKGVPILAPLPPVVFNALIIGLELTYLTVGAFQPGVFGVFALQVGAGELLVCYVIGLPLLCLMRRVGLDRVLSMEEQAGAATRTQ